jgi:hypothetical protein
MMTVQQLKLRVLDNGMESSNNTDAASIDKIKVLSTILA